MPRKLLANIALCSTIAQAITTRLLMKSFQDDSASAVAGHVSTLEGYADAAEAANASAKAESDASDALLASAQSSSGSTSTLLGLLNDAKSNLEDVTTHSGTAQTQYDQARALANGDLATAFVSETNSGTASITEAIGQKAAITGAFATAAGHAAAAGTAEVDARGYMENTQDVVDQIQDMYDSAAIDAWLNTQTITKSGCGKSAADVALVEVDGVLRMFIGSNCTTLKHIYFTWRWAPDAWDKVKDSIKVSSGLKNIPYVSGNPARAVDTIEITCTNKDSYQNCKAVVPANGSTKVGIEFSSDEVNYGDMVSAFEHYTKWFFGSL